MFAVIHLPNFALQAALRHEPELWTKPVALVDSALSAPRICGLTDAAHASGVTEGLTPTQALARCRDLLMRSRSVAQEAAATEAILQCACGFSPNIENTSPGVVTLDLRRLAELKASGVSRQFPGTRPALTAWADRLRTSLASLNLRASIGIGPTPNVARHAACWGALISRSSRREEAHSSKTEIRNPRCEIDPEFPALAPMIVTDSQSFVASLPVAALEPSTDVALILHKWGIRTVGELLALGQEALAERLGLEALALFAAAATTAVRPLNTVRPSERFEESFEFKHEIETLEPLLFILRRFADQISHRLELAGLAAELLTLRLRLESGEIFERRLRVPQPTRQADTLFRMLHTHLENLRTDAAIVAVALKADSTQPEQKQFGLFEAALRDPHRFQETLAQLSALVGAERVGTPVRENSHRPDAFRLVPPDFENAPRAVRQRASEILRSKPLRRFRPALETKVECETESTERANVSAPLTRTAVHPLPSSDEGRGQGEGKLGIHEAKALQSPRPISIRCAIANGKLRIAVGPWRASGNWWEPGAWQREEWDVATRDGAALRLVQRPGGWFVEGIMD